MPCCSDLRLSRRPDSDAAFETNVDGRGVDVRVATTPVIFGEKTVLRLLDKSRSLYALSNLGMPAESVAARSDRALALIESALAPQVAATLRAVA